MYAPRLLTYYLAVRFVRLTLGHGFYGPAAYTTPVPPKPGLFTLL